MTFKIKTALGIILMVLAIAGTGLATEQATPVEVQEKVKAAVKLIQEEGPDAAFKKISDKNGEFVWKDSYVVIVHMNGEMLMHPYVPKLIGKNMLGAKDANGKLFEVEIRNMLKEQNSCWIDFVWVKPGTKTPRQKVSYVERVPGTDILVNSGVYDLTKDEVLKMVN